jgi:hypothetical protein
VTNGTKNQEATMSKRAMFKLTVYGAPYSDGEYYGTADGMREAAKAAKGLCPGQRMLASACVDGSEMWPVVAKWVCGPDGKVSRVNP